MFEAPKAKKAINGTEESPTIRSFVALALAKIYRKLPQHTFQNSVCKLVMTIISKGLRQRDLSCREKGRKALLNLIIELSPRPQVLTLVFSDMKEQLQKAGYQLHTLIYSIHHLL
jgi:hypothetical protein